MFESIVEQLQEIRRGAAKELAAIDVAINILVKPPAGFKRSLFAVPDRPKRVLSAAARKRISRAQKARWAKVHRQNGYRKAA
jgi:hypothetical protein